MKLEAIDHICIAVRNLEEAQKIYEDILGLKLSIKYKMESERIHVARYYIGEVALELMEPTDENSEVAKFLQRRGEGFFLISYRVNDVEKVLSELKDKCEETIDKKPREFTGNRYAFIQPPGRLSGVLTEVLDGEFNLQF